MGTGPGSFRVILEDVGASMSTLKQDAAQQALYEVEFDLNKAILKQLKKLTPEEFTELLGAIPKLADKLVEEFV